MATPFDYLVTSLSAKVPRSKKCRPQHAKPDCKTEVMRRYLKEGGPATTVVLAIEADLSSPSLVTALLKADMATGKIHWIGNKLAWNHDFDEQLDREIRAAILLLRRAGYKVVAPATPA